MRLVLSVIFLVIEVPASAHDWYSGTRNPATGSLCCNQSDCRSVAASEVEMHPTLYVHRPSGRYILRNHAQASHDNRWHICGAENVKEMRCIFIPIVPGS